MSKIERMALVLAMHDMNQAGEDINVFNASTGNM
jgi:hypothetical protein